MFKSQIDHCKIFISFSILSAILELTGEVVVHTHNRTFLNQNGMVNNKKDIQKKACFFI